MKKGVDPHFGVVAGFKTVTDHSRNGTRREIVTSPGNDSRDGAILDKLGNCYGVMSPEMSAKKKSS